MIASTIDRIEFDHAVPSKLLVSFFYTCGHADTFVFVKTSSIDAILEAADFECPPETLLVAVRRVGNLTLH